MTDRVPASYALSIARAFAYYLRPACERLEVAGSIRRRKKTVKDIEIVAIPRAFVAERDLFGEVTAWNDKIQDCIDDANAREWPWLQHVKDEHGNDRDGDRYKMLVDTRTNVRIDLFLVRPPAQWGVIYLIRTGSADFNKKLIAHMDTRGMKFRDGRLLDKHSKVIDTPEEIDVFKACGVKYKSPEYR